MAAREPGRSNAEGARRFAKSAGGAFPKSKQCYVICRTSGGTILAHRRLDWPDHGAEGNCRSRPAFRGTAVSATREELSTRPLVAGASVPAQDIDAALRDPLPAALACGPHQGRYRRGRSRISAAPQSLWAEASRSAAGALDLCRDGRLIPQSRSADGMTSSPI